MRFSLRSGFEDEDGLDGAPSAPAVFDLSVTNPTRVGLSSDAYEPDPLGMLTARRAVVSHYARRGHAISEADIVLSASTSEAYAWLFKLLADPGDAVLVPTPSYPLFGCLAELESVRLVHYALSRDEHFRIDVGAIERALAEEPRVRAIVVVAPNNPTGTVVFENDARALEALAARTGVPLVVDEVFADYLDPGVDASALRVSWASSDAVLTFVLSGLSKVLCAPGAKLGWTLVRGPASDRTEALRRLGIIADAYLSVSSRVQRELGEVLPTADEVQRMVRARLDENRSAAQEIAQRSEGLVHVLPSHGGWSIIVEVPRVMTDAEWVRTLETEGVRVQAGSLFDLRGNRSLVVSLLPAADMFRAGFSRLSEIVARVSRE